MDIVVWVLRAVLALVFLGMGISHFMGPVRRTMRAMIPPALAPHAAFLVAFTGLCEIAGGIGLVLPWQLIGAEWMRWVVGALLVAFLIAVFPANAYAASRPEKFGRAAFPFWPRYVAQLGLILAVVLAAAPIA
ncbi:MAG: hypothetical protein ABI566_02000 [Pseudolysinimonas sp.]